MDWPLGVPHPLESASRIILEDGVRRGVGPRLVVLVGMTASVGGFRSIHSLGARLNTTSDYPLHHSRCTKLTKSIYLSVQEEGKVKGGAAEPQSKNSGNGGPLI